MLTQDYVTSKELELQPIASLRSYEEAHERKYDYRTDADIDFARIIYSSAFRRLQGKMQLFIPDGINFHRNRLTHSMEVAQIARTIAKRLKLNDTLTVMSCSLAHDLGNPPFGHAGEVVISKLSNKSDYEGNAQTFRILDHLEEKNHSFNGLNLTLRTLLGVVKYPYKKSTRNKKYVYTKDYKLIKSWASKFNLTLKTIDCEIMDLADEIAYAAHDLEDAFRLKYFTINDLIYEFTISQFKEALPELEEIVKDARDFAFKSDAYKSSEEYAILFRKELTSIIVDRLIKDIEVIDNKNSGPCLGFKTYSKLAKGLKVLTFNAIKRNPEIYRYELLGEKVLQGLYIVYMDNKFNKDQKLLPAEYRDILNRERTVLDYIGGMQDNYAITQYKIYYGKNSLDQVYKQPCP